MKTDRRSFLTGGALSATAAIIGAGAERNRIHARQSDMPIKTREPRVITRMLKDAGSIPNSRLPVLIYQGVLVLSGSDPASAIEALIHQQQWGNDWRNGIFTYHHYHSTAHEALLVYSGSAKVQLGGEEGIIDTVSAGDVIIIPAGVGHKNLGSSSDFHVIGAYPPNQNVDMKFGKPGERPRADENIARVALPITDPVFGKTGPLLEHWRSEG